MNLAEHGPMKFCSHCAQPMSPSEEWPVQCTACARIHYRNPTPVAVVLLPVDDGVLTVRRAIDPGKGRLALPGGFVNWGETWQEAAARELFEETAILIEASELALLDAQSVEDGALLLFAQAKARLSSELDWQIDPKEVSEVVILKEPWQLAFPTHTRQLQAYFQARASAAPDPTADTSSALETPPE